MRTAIVDLGPDGRSLRGGLAPAPSTRDRGLITALSVACVAFALAVWLGRSPAPATVGAPLSIQMYDRTGERPLYQLVLPPNTRNVDLGMLPDRLANESLPSGWLRPITVRGTSGLAADEGVVVIAWTERGMLYWLSSTSHTADQLIQIAGEMR